MDPGKFLEMVQGEWDGLWEQNGHVDCSEEDRLNRQISEIRVAIHKLTAEHGYSLGTLEPWKIGAEAKASTGLEAIQVRPADVLDYPRLPRKG